MSALEARIDDLYRLKLTEFTGARNALAKSLAGDDAARVRALAKPTIVAWAVNQVYWRARSTYERLIKSGEKLRAAQIASLEGRAAEVRAASDAHRRAIADAVAEAGRLAAEGGAKPAADEISRTLEALSLLASSPAWPGRLTEPIQPAGLEALAGVTDIPARRETPEVRRGRPELVTSPLPSAAARVPAAAARAAEKEAAREAAEKKKRDAAVKVAEEAVTRADADERKARDVWERAHDALLAARQALSDLRRSRFRSS